MSSVCVCNHFDFAHKIGIEGRGECGSCSWRQSQNPNSIIACSKFEPQVPVVPTLP